MNVGSCARVMQNFGIYDLKIVQGSSFVFEPTPDDDSSDDDDDDDINDKNDEKKNRRTTTQYENKDEASETEGEMPDLFTASLLTSNKDAKKTMSGEAYRFACAADWMLERASKEAWYPDVKSATADRTVVFATTARNRDGSQPMLDSREACRKAAKLALDGEKVSFLFGNERVGLTNEELRTAQYLVAIPTAGVGEVCGKSLKYTGSSGPTSLNLSHAVGVVASRRRSSRRLWKKTEEGKVDTDRRHHRVVVGLVVVVVVAAAATTTIMITMITITAISIARKARRL